MCPPEIRNVHGKHNSFVTAKREYFYKQRRPDSKLKSKIMLHFTRIYTVCYGKKELQVQKYNILEKFTWHPFFHTMDFPMFIIVLNQKVKIH